MKPRVMSLVIFTCAVGLLTSPNQIPLIDSLICIFFVTVGAGAAGALNMWYEADLDSLMTNMGPLLLKISLILMKIIKLFIKI